MTTPHSHLTEEDLVLHYYGELPPSGESAAAVHLAACPDCRAEYTTLQRILGAVDETSVSQVDLPSSFERTVWARLEPNLPREQRGWIAWLMASPAPLGVAASIVVLVVGAFFAGRAFTPAPPAVPAPATAAAPVSTSVDQFRERVLLADLGDHLARSQMVLVELVSAESGEPGDRSGERARVEQLVADSRLYRQTAEDTGDTAVSDLLDEIERVLTELAAGPEQMSAQALADIRHRIEARDLLFKVRVIASEVRQRQKESIQRRVVQQS